MKNNIATREVLTEKAFIKVRILPHDDFHLLNLYWYSEFVGEVFQVADYQNDNELYIFKKFIGEQIFLEEFYGRNIIGAVILKRHCTKKI